MERNQKAKARIGAMLACKRYREIEAALEAAIAKALYESHITRMQKEVAQRAWVDGYLTGANDTLEAIAELEGKTLEMGKEKEVW